MARKKDEQNVAPQGEPMHGMEEMGQEPLKIPREDPTVAGSQAPMQPPMQQGPGPMQAPGGMEPMHSPEEIGMPYETPARNALQNPAMFQKDASGVGLVGPIGEEAINKAIGLLEKYRNGKKALENKIVENERWWKLRQWDLIHEGESEEDRVKGAFDPDPKSAWLHNTITNLHADIMDNYPEPVVQPRAEEDKESAKILSDIIPRILEQSNFPQIYSSVSYYKLKFGTGVYSVVWDSELNNGLGDVAIRKADLLKLYWEPGVVDIQKSRNFFSVDILDRDEVHEMFPQIDISKVGGDTQSVAKYAHDDNYDEYTEKVLLVDWYYKKIVNGKKVVHYAKFAGDQLIYASENDPEYEQIGYYDHGLYPYFFDVLFPLEDTPAGFGYIDICKSPQLYIDKLDASILKHAGMGARARFFVRNDGAVNEEEYADYRNDLIHWNGTGDPNESIIPIQIPNLSSIYVDIRNLKIDEMKETAGNRDVSQGGSVAGITAASAIAALQEAGSKRSRDMIRHSYFIMEDVYQCIISLKRQFDKYPTSYRVTDKQTGDMSFVQFSGQDIAPQPQEPVAGMDMGYRTPEFDVKVVAQKASAFSTAAQNERAKELYALGFFNPDMADQALACLDMMAFEGIDSVKTHINENKTLNERLQQMGMLALAMAQQLDAVTGSQYTQQVAQAMQAGRDEEGPSVNATQRQNMGITNNEKAMDRVGGLTQTEKEGESSITANARARAAEASAPR